jgi:uncharacterized membrane protein
MANLPIILIAIGVILLALALFVAFTGPKRSSTRDKGNIHKKRAAIQFVIGLFLSLIGAFLMINGTLLGENTVSIARVIGIIGIALIATSYTTLPFMMNKENKNKEELQ